MCSETADLRRKSVRFAGQFCRDGHGPSPTMARRNGLGAFNMGGLMLAEHMNVFPTGSVPPSGYIRHSSLHNKSQFLAFSFV